MSPKVSHVHVLPLSVVRGRGYDYLCFRDLCYSPKVGGLMLRCM